MDAISYSYADKQAKRIKKFINNPDSNSGIVTVPKVIASGENITVPAGRVAVLPNVQVDGTLNVQGDVFIPSGATLSGVVEKVTSTDNAVVRFNGTTGAVQNSGVVIDDNGNVGIGVTPSPWYNGYKNIEMGTVSSFGDYAGYGYFITQLRNNAYENNGWKYKQNGYASMYEQYAGLHSWYTAPSGTTGDPIAWTNAMTLDASGNLLLTSGTGALGYGAGAGGTVTQLTSKSTAVTLNKLSGEIIMHNEALVPGASVRFMVYNNLSGNGVVIVQGSFNYFDPGNYRIEAIHKNYNSFEVRVTNISNMTLSENLAIKFVFINGSIT